MKKITYKSNLIQRVSYLLLILFGSSQFLFPQLPFPKTYADKFQQILDNGYVTDKAKGAAMTVYSAKCGMLWSGKAGKAYLSPDTMVTAASMFRLASVSKTFCAVIIFKLAEQGKLSINDPISKYLRSTLVDTMPYGKSISIRHLLQHSSGLPSHTSSQAFNSLINANLLRYVSPEQCIKYSVDMGTTTPGSKFAYSNTGFLVAAMIAEKASGKSYRQLMLDIILTPLGLTSTMYPNPFPNSHKLPAYHIHEYRNATTTTQVVYGSADWLMGSGEMISNAPDLAFRYFPALIGGQLISSTSVTEMFKVNGVSGNNMNYGLGAYTTNASCGQYKGHGGNLFGISTGIIYAPAVDAYISFGENIYGTSGGPYLCNVINELKTLTVCPTGISESDRENWITIYPNPTDGNFTVQGESNGDQKIRIDLFDVTGKRIYSEEDITKGNAFIKQYNLSWLENGIYVLAVTSGSGYWQEKIVMNSK